MSDPREPGAPEPDLPLPPEALGLWAVLRKAIGGEHGHDYTAGPIGRAILLLAVPMVLEMAMESVFAVADVFWVSRLGADAVATVGLTESMLAIVYTVAMGLSIGVGATVARRIGEKAPEQAAETAVQGLGLGVLLGAGLGVAGALFAPELLRLLGASPEVVRIGAPYTRVILGGNVVVMLLFLINAVFRGAGDAAIAMRVLWLANLINIVLGPLLIFGVGPFPRLGVTGAAIATTIGRGIGVLFQLWNLTRPARRVSVARRHLRLEPGLMLKLLRLSGSGMLQVLIGSASWIGLVRVVAGFGSAALAGYTIGFRIILFALMPSWGLSNAAATMVGQGLGAGKPDRAEQAVWRAGLYNLVFLSAVGFFFVAAAGPIVSVFSQDPAVATVAMRCLRIVALGFPLYAYGMVLGQAFNGAGDTWTPTWINLFCFWLFEIPVAWALSTRAGMGPTGAFAAITAAFSMLAIASAVLFRRGRWKLRTV
jgi:putative MATE family efflux protein